MDATTIAVDLAKDVFEIAGANRAGRIVEHGRLSRRQFERFLATVPAGTEIIMEACGTAHYWGRQCQGHGLAPRLLPAQYVRAYVRRNKSDRADAEALLEAHRCGEIQVVPVKTPEQQALHGLHQVRRQWQSARTARINAIRGLLREQGIPLRLGATTIRRTVPALIDDPARALPPLLCAALRGLLDELRDLERRLHDLDASLTRVAAADPVARRLQTVPGVGVIIATSLISNVPHIHAFRRGRHFASWLGLTPREAASGTRRWRGHISKRGDVYLRTLLTHGARSILVNAQRRARANVSALTALQRWAVDLAARRGQNKAASALANKLARIVWAVWRSDVDFSADTTRRHAAA
jgi:transposase